MLLYPVGKYNWFKEKTLDAPFGLIGQGGMRKVVLVVAFDSDEASLLRVADIHTHTQTAA